ncbi:hypothetical protein DH2020_027402 [Rehmannia glutinosa]|uniref:Sialate O-acetylesterase domain-containing protein n=1 Tax=Rehmannia glutinosa TaxID=99300 RepID=A0ABR0VX62_REHGL
MAFANSVLKRDSSIGVIGLVPCAIGGTSIRQWSQGSDNYNRMLSRARAALRDGGQIRAILWYQGESDTVDLKDAESYRGERKSFSRYSVILASADQGGEYLDKVRKAQMDIKLPNLRNIDALGMKLKTDRVHLSTEAEVEVGKRLADAFLQFTVSPLA